MEITLDKKHENAVTLVAKGVSVAMANSIRRYTTVRVPVLAMDKVVFYENNSALFDEYIAHRLGLMPVVTPAKLPKEAEISFRLDETGPKVVCAEDLKSSDNEIIVARGRIPVVTLTEKQHLRLEATTRLGRGIEHAKFQAGLVSYGVDEDKIRFLVESFYQMSPRELVMRGCEELEEDLGELVKLVKKMDKPGKKKKKEKEE